MKTFRNGSAGMRFMSSSYKIIFSFVLMCVLVLSAPGSFHNVYAAPLEDCDLDGFDDATGVPVPWPGYDETKGDTPDGPAGSKTTAAVPDSTASGTTNSEVSGKSGSENSDSSSSVKTGDSKAVSSGKTDNTKTDNTKTDNTKDANSGKTENGAATKTSSSVQDKAGKTDSSVSGKAETTKSDNTGKAESGKADSAAKDNAGETEYSKTGSTASDKEDKAAGSTESGITGSTASGKEDNVSIKAESGKTGGTAQDTTDSSEADSADGAISEAPDSAEAAVAGANAPDETSLGQSEETEENTDYVDSEASDTLTEELEAVINTKGSLEIFDVSGSLIHAGSPVLISGSGFAGAVDNLEIVIQSESRQLGIVESSETGSFEAQFNIPEELKAGVHHIVVLYQGKEIARQEIEIGPKAANSFLQALSVGFTSDNAGLLPGLMILLGLFISGAVVLALTVLFRPRPKKS